MKHLLTYSRPRHFLRYLTNTIITRLPILVVRMFWWRLFISMGSNCNILRQVTVRDLRNISLGDTVNINQYCMLDSRGGPIRIGSNVDIAPEVNIWTLQHDPQSPDFATKGGGVTIEDFVWLGNRAVILPGVTIGRGAVVATGAIVTKDVAAWTIVGGIPAKKIGERNPDQSPRQPFRPFLL
jgi:maltose O-acetyltransferase